MTSLNIDQMTSASAWTSPVLLPIGPVTVLPIMAASMGFLVPFVIFIVSFFVYIMWDIWFSNLKQAMDATESVSMMRRHTREDYQPFYRINFGQDFRGESKGTPGP